MNKILLLSGNDSIWTKRCIEHSDILGKNDIYTVSLKKEEYDRFFKKNGIKIFRVKRHSMFDRIPKLRGLVLILDYLRGIDRLRKKVGSFDVVHVSYVNREKMLAVRLLRKYSKKIVCTFWGSDLLRASEKMLLSYRKSLRLADAVMLETADVKEKFISVYGNEFNSKLHILKFGNEGLEYIDPEDTASYREQFSIPEDKTVVTIGYNGSAAQNHIKVIESLAKLDGASRDKLFLLLPVTYSMPEGYKEKLVGSLEALGCGYRLFESFLDEPTLGRLRKCTDIFIHAQRTDSFSASVQEYLYAQKLVFNAAWIKYGDLKDVNVYFREFSDYDELRQMVSDYLDNGLSSEEKERLKQNTPVIWDMVSWDALADKWHSLYQVGK